MLGWDDTGDAVNGENVCTMEMNGEADGVVVGSKLGLLLGLLLGRALGV